MQCSLCGEEWGADVVSTDIGQLCEGCVEQEWELAELDRAEAEGISYEELEEERAERNARDAYDGGECHEI